MDSHDTPSAHLGVEAFEQLVREIRTFKPDAVLATVAGDRVLPADDVIVRIGGEAPYPFIERCGVRIVKKALAVEDSGSDRMAG